MKPSFEINLLPEAVDFLDNLDSKTKEKQKSKKNSYGR